MAINTVVAKKRKRLKPQLQIWKRKGRKAFGRRSDSRTGDAEKATETLSETQKRNPKINQDGPKRKVRKGGHTALAFLAEMAEKERKLKEERNRLERERQEMEKEKTEKFMKQQNDRLTAILEMQRQQNNQVQASQMVLMQQQQQQWQALIAPFSKIVDKENQSY